MRKEIIREDYLEKLRRGKDDTDAVKIITGMRRSGKSTLMKQYMASLESAGVSTEDMIYANLESKEFDDINDFKKLNAWLEPRMDKTRKYVFLDEIQRITGWEKTINSLMTDYDADIYITGSNAYLLSSDLATYISGRYVEITMLPLSFREFLTLNPVTPEEDRYFRMRQYIQTGSLPMVEPERDEQYTADLLNGIYNTIVRKDVQTHLRIRDTELFESIVRFLMSNIGNMTNCTKVAEAVDASPATVRKYVRGLEDAYLIHKAERFDIAGKRILKSYEKYYVTDTGIRNTAMGIDTGKDLGRQLENIVYLELIRRGYRVMVGCYRDKEVDFTAVRGGSVEYFQVTQTMADDTVFERETRSLKAVRDNYPKTVLSMDPIPDTIGDGILHRNIIDWLLEEPNRTDR